jgi:hypothetical protein
MKTKHYILTITDPQPDIKKVLMEVLGKWNGINVVSVDEVELVEVPERGK